MPRSAFDNCQSRTAELHVLRLGFNAEVEIGNLLAAVNRDRKVARI
jgi:hypothetical protein